ncbi:MAG: hypothetical protein KME43_14895 [Myxacorys chilensis ATA2-1-KO14]|jgi:hypothetical protein|nr:hypothetical protein [Myxacorys chilensis ATA2-1-KO14]
MSELAPIFLSAGIPDRDLDRYPADPIAIREAILALVTQTVRDRELVFGGHPAISPLVDHASRTLEAQHHVYIYQSRWFENVIPDVAKAFPNLIWTQKKSTLEESLTVMRREIIGSRPFAAAVFIGGMGGLFEECTIFKELHPNKPIFPIASTLGAAQILFEQDECSQNEEIRQALATNKRYRALFRKILPSSN